MAKENCNSVKRNFSYNIIYQILILILPLITAPYVSRVLGAEGVGIYSYTYSISNYFVLFAMLGINNYGNRCIAKVKENKVKLDKIYSSIYVLQFITASLAVIIYLIYVVFLEKSYTLYFLIQTIYVVSSIFDINWLFFGLEKFKLTITRNIVVKILSTMLIFVFVKTKNDLINYVLILSMSTLISQLMIWPFLRQNVKLQKVKWEDIKIHIKPNLKLFIPVIAISVYNLMDKIMLGKLANAMELGLYENAEKIINIPITVISALGTVMMPRISNLLANKNDKKAKNYFDKSMKMIMFLAVPSVYGLIAIGKDFAPLFFGNEFEWTGFLIQVLSITILFKAWANVIRTQYLLPKEEDNFYVTSVVLGALINFILNLILIPPLKSLGAIIGTIMAEMVVALYQTYSIRKQINIKEHLKYIAKYLLTGLAMYLIIILFKNYIDNKYLLIFIQIVLGGLLYAIFNYRYVKQNIKEIIRR